MTSCSPALFSTVQTSTTPSWSDGVIRVVQGGLIQLRGLYEPPSEWMRTDPSALSMIARVASGRCAVSRPT